MGDQPGNIIGDVEGGIISPNSNNYKVVYRRKIVTENYKTADLNANITFH